MKTKRNFILYSIFIFFIALGITCMLFFKPILSSYITSITRYVNYNFISPQNNTTTVETNYSPSEYDSDDLGPKEFDLAFGVFGDIHDSTSNFQVAIDDLYNINPRLDSVVLSGDMVDQGLDSQYDDIQNILDENKTKLPNNIIKNIGNHEFYNYEKGKNNKNENSAVVQKYLNFAQVDNVYHDTYINGYHFISLGSEVNNSENYDRTTAYLSQEQLNWFKNTIKQNYQPKKPIFVFLHQPLFMDFWGSRWCEVNPYNDLFNILSDYPEVILFTSHSHKNFESDSVKTNLPFTAVHTGAVSYTIFPDSSSNDGLKRDHSYSNYLYVTVKNNTVTLIGRNVTNNTESMNKQISY